MSFKKLFKKVDFNNLDLRKLDLTRKYEEGFGEDDGIAMRDHLMLYCVTAVVCFFVGWACLAKIDEVARGEARVVPASEIQSVQTLEGGIIDDFEVKEGDKVTEGQTLFHLRNIQAQSDYQANMQKYYGLKSMVSRLQAEADGKELQFDDDLRNGAPESVFAEEQAYLAGRQQYKTQNNVLAEQLTQKEQELTSLTQRIEDTKHMLRYSQEEKQMVEPAVERGSLPKMQMLQLNREIAERQTELNSLTFSLPKVKAAINEAQQRLEDHENTYKAEARKQLAERSTILKSLTEELNAFRDRTTRTDVKSPVTGTIKTIKIKTVGGVARPGDVIMEIVPAEDSLVIEAKIKPSDIAFIYPTQRAVVRVSAYDFSIYGALQGTVTDISADSFTTDRGETYYRVRVKANDKALIKDGKEHKIIPGMQATVDIITGRKTIMNYLLKPFLKASRTAMHER